MKFDDPAQIEADQVLQLPPDAPGPGVQCGAFPGQPQQLSVRRS